ncbi:class I adenylate-forming enzyme family protein [Brevibacillus sp. B_LB10_24]|uniref:class I adenylate-forming enzyme family protein n=1 Tax=Brevibacillus sp. B_LB10_24 TaxID=3380645 RepID=UPI0038BD538C
MAVLHSYLKERAAQTPDAEALVSPHRRITYREFYQRTIQLSAFLADLGVVKGDRVGILCKNDHPYPTILLAALQAGAVAIPLNWRLTAYELEGIMQDAQAKMLFYDKEFEESLSRIQATGLVPIRVPVAEGMELTDEFAAIFTDRKTAIPPEVDLSEDDLAFVLYTSGTTGIPKGCMLSHACYDRYLQESRPRFDRPVRFLAVHPLFHMSSTSMILYNIYSGNTMVFLTERDPASILAAIEKENIETMFAFPSVYAYLLEEWKRKNREISSLKFVSTGGTKASSALIRRYLELGIPMAQGYGSTEASFVSGWHPLMGMDTVDSVGKPFKHVQVKIVHPDTGQEMPTGQVGEVIVKSPYLFKGYLNKPEATAKVLIDGWFHTGDAGTIDREGYLYISGRYKEMILVGGDNVYPGEVEDVIQKIPGVLEVAVVGVPHETLGETPLAYVVKQEGSTLTDAEIVGECRKRLAAYKIPDVVFVRDLPVNAVGKVVKQALTTS